MATAPRVVDPPAAPAARPFARLRGSAPLVVLIVASVAARLPALLNARGVNSDAAVVGLQAMHILHGEWSWFLWGAGYQASLDAVLVAGAFAITGPSALTLMVVPLIGYLVLVGLTYDVLRRAVGRGSAAVACLPLVLAPQPINGVALYAPRQWAITATVLAVWLASRACGRRAPLWLAGSGFVAGFAVYLDLFTLQMMPAVGVFALWCAFTAPPRCARSALRAGAVSTVRSMRSLAAPPERPSPRPLAYRGRAVGALLLGLAAGVAVIAWSRVQPVADGAKAGLTLDKIGASWTLLVDQCLPYLLGVKVFVQDPVTLDHVPWPAPWPLQVVQVGAASAFAAAACWAAVAVVRRIGPVAVRRLGALGLIGTAASIGGFLVSTMPADLLSARYLAPIVWFAPFTLAPAAHALGTRWFAVAIAPLVVAVGVGGWYAYAPYVQNGILVRDPRGVAQDEVVLADALREQGIHYAAAQYWLAYRLTFLCDEDPVVVPFAVADDRYRPYRDGFGAAPVVAYVFHPSEPRVRPEALEAQLDAQRATYRREVIAGFTVLVVRR